MGFGVRGIEHDREVAEAHRFVEASEGGFVDRECGDHLTVVRREGMCAAEMLPGRPRLRGAA
jgi:hypothetical protein